MTGRMAGLFPCLPMQGDNRAKNPVGRGSGSGSYRVRDRAFCFSSRRSRKPKRSALFLSFADTFMALLPQQNFGKGKHLIIHLVQTEFLRER
jgi:hypothetical protein